MIAVIDGRHVCYETTNGRDRRYRGCSHKTPRGAIRHEAPVYVSALRVSGLEVAPSPGAPQQGSGLSGLQAEAAKASSRSTGTDRP